MTSTPVYSTALQQALCLLPHISPTEMKVLISAAKAQWAPRFSNEILADSFRYLSRKTLTEKICPTMSSPPVYSTALQQALTLLPHISSTEMKVLISAAKAQWAPRFSNEILADSFRYLSRKTLTEKICPVNSRYFQICVNSVPNVHNISRISVENSNEEEPTLHLRVPYVDCYDGDCISDEHRIELGDFPNSAPFLRFEIVSIGTHFYASRICEFFRSHRESFSEFQLLKMWVSCFESKNVLAESNVQLCGLLADVFQNCKRVKIYCIDDYARQTIPYIFRHCGKLTCYRRRRISNDIFQDGEKLSANDESLRNKWIRNMVAYITHYLFNTPNAFLRVNVAQESLAVLIFEKVKKVFKCMTMETEFCLSLIYRPDEIQIRHQGISTVENDATQQQLLLFKCTYLDELSEENCGGADHPPEEHRMWCRKVKPNDVKVMSCGDETSTLLLQKECENLYYDYSDNWDTRY